MGATGVRLEGDPRVATEARLHLPGTLGGQAVLQDGLVQFGISIRLGTERRGDDARIRFHDAVGEGQVGLLDLTLGEQRPEGLVSVPVLHTEHDATGVLIEAMPQAGNHSGLVGQECVQLVDQRSMADAARWMTGHAGRLVEGDQVFVLVEDLEIIRRLDVGHVIRDTEADGDEITLTWSLAGLGHDAAYLHLAPLQLALIEVAAVPRVVGTQQGVDAHPGLRRIHLEGERPDGLGEIGVLAFEFGHPPDVPRGRRS